VIKFKQGKDLTLKSKIATLNVSVTCIYTRPFVIGEFLILKVGAEYKVVSFHLGAKTGLKMHMLRNHNYSIVSWWIRCNSRCLQQQ